MAAARDRSRTLGQVGLDEPEDDLLDFGELGGLIFGLRRGKLDRFGPEFLRQAILGDWFAIEQLDDPLGLILGDQPAHEPLRPSLKEPQRIATQKQVKCIGGASKRGSLTIAPQAGKSPSCTSGVPS